MQPIEIVLFGAITALAAGLIGYLLWPFARGRRAPTARHHRPTARPLAAAEPPARSMVCPACQREYEAGLQFCPHDARELVPARDHGARAAAPGMTCPSCRRSFDAMKRFCPFDGDELVPLTIAIGSAPAVGGAGMGAVGGMSGLGGVGVGGLGGGNVGAVEAMGKICPHCSRRYESEATFCGRDGSALVAVN